MKPITTTNPEGRALLALRAGPMTPGEIGARIGSSLPGWLIKAGYVHQDESYYRLTDAGRAACPYRNPLAAPGAIQPKTFKPETDMSREYRITRQQVLAVITEAGAAGITKAQLVAKLEHLAPENAITSHLVMLKKDGSVSNESRGIWVDAALAENAPPAKVVINDQGKQHHATRENVLGYLGKLKTDTGAIPETIANMLGCTVDSTKAVLAGLFAGLKVDREKFGNDFAYFITKPKVEEPVAKQDSIAAHTHVHQSIEGAEVTITTPVDQPISPIEISAELAPAVEEMIVTAVAAMEPEPEPVAPVMTVLPVAVFDEVIYSNPESIDFGIWSNGALTFVDGATTVKLSAAVTKKLRGFLGLFNEAA